MAKQGAYGVYFIFKNMEQGASFRVTRVRLGRNGQFFRHVRSNGNRLRPELSGGQKSHSNQTGAFAYMALRRPPTTLEYGLG
jgi:hypothetical protein